MLLDPRTGELRRASAAEVAEAESRRARRRNGGAPAPGGGGSDGGEAAEFYAALKRELVKNAALCGGSLALYLRLSGQEDAAVSELVGCAAGLAYLALLMRYVDKLSQEDVGSAQYDGNVSDLLRLALGSVFDTYRQALGHPRLLVPVGVAAACSWWNHAHPFDKPDFQFGFLLIGFLTYKASVLYWSYENDLKPALIDAFVGPDPNAAKSKAPPRPTVLSDDAFDELVRIKREAAGRSEE